MGRGALAASDPGQRLLTWGRPRGSSQKGSVAAASAPPAWLALQYASSAGAGAGELLSCFSSGGAMGLLL